jgi:hypothetical protein
MLGVPSYSRAWTRPNALASRRLVKRVSALADTQHLRKSTMPVCVLRPYETRNRHMPTVRQIVFGVALAMGICAMKPSQIGAKSNSTTRTMSGRSTTPMPPTAIGTIYCFITAVRLSEDHILNKLMMLISFGVDLNAV